MSYDLRNQCRGLTEAKCAKKAKICSYRKVFGEPRCALLTSYARAQGLSPRARGKGQYGHAPAWKAYLEEQGGSLSENPCTPVKKSKACTKVGGGSVCRWATNLRQPKKGGGGAKLSPRCVLRPRAGTALGLRARRRSGEDTERLARSYAAKFGVNPSPTWSPCRGLYPQERCEQNADLGALCYFRKAGKKRSPSCSLRRGARAVWAGGSASAGEESGDEE